VSRVTEPQRQLATWLLLHEAGDRDDSAADGALRVWVKLSARLARIFTVSGCDALAARAIYLAQADFPALAAAIGGPSLGLDGLPRALAETEEPEAFEAAVAVLGNVNALLVTFIGEELALRTIRDVWPGAAVLAFEQAGQEASS